MANDIATLSNTVRGALSNLNGIIVGIDAVNRRLTTGLKVASPVDDPSAYFTATSLRATSSDYTNLLNDINLASSALSTANTALTSVQSLLNTLTSLAQSALASTSTTTRDGFRTSFNNTLTQINTLVGDATFNGNNFLSSSPSTLNVQFNPTNTSSLSIAGRNTTTSASGLNIPTQAANSWDVGNDANINTAITAVASGLATLKATISIFSNYSAIVSARVTFNTSYTGVLDEGVGKLVNADLEEDGALLTSLQTLQTIATNAINTVLLIEGNVVGLFNQNN